MQGSDNHQQLTIEQPGAARALVEKFATGSANKFGSDIYIRIGTLQYWNSNQVAHAMMGFAGTSLTSLAFLQYCGPRYIVLSLAFMIFPI
jgi:hypothetical protein